MKYTLKRIVVCLIPFTLISCGALFNQPLTTQEARLGELTPKTIAIRNLPKPEKKIIVGVYNFKDQTGQYKASETSSTFSTAVTQGATTILLKALEDSQWFRPLERENLSNLLQERKIISATRNEYATDRNNIKKITPMLFAGIILEGGVISYDTNILTGGAGARYFGVGGSTQYRQDRITIYLRVVSTSTGEILKNVYVSKTILSQAVDAGLFRYVNFQRLLEAEVGFSKNEPTEIAVKEAIEKAVENLIFEGIKDNLWSADGGEEVNKAITEAYETEKIEEESVGLYEREQRGDVKYSASVFGGLAYIDGDLPTRQLDFNAGIGAKYHLNNTWRVDGELSLFKLFSSPEINSWWLSQDINLEYRLLAKDKLSPYVFAGVGAMYFVDNSPGKYLQTLDGYGKLQYGLGFEYQTTKRITWYAKAKFNLTFTDKIDDTVNGLRDDYFYNFSLGFNYNFGK